MMSVTEPARRFEVFTGAGQRRRWAPAEKAQIVAESFSGAESVCAVARRHGLASTQLFAWRKEARDRAAETSFVPVLVEAARPAVVAEPSKKRRRRSRDGGIELEIDGGGGAGEPWRRGEDGGGGDPGPEGGAVIAPPAGVKVLVATKPIDFRKGANGLAALIKNEMRDRPVLAAWSTSSATKRANRVKLLLLGRHRAWCWWPRRSSRASSAGRRSRTERCG